MYQPKRLVGVVCCGLIAALSLAATAQEPRAAKPGPEAKDAVPNLSKTQVSIPWDDLVTLLGRGDRDERNRPPVDYVFSQAACNVVVEADRANIHTTVEVNALGPRWSLVPLGPAGLGVVAAKADGEACPLVLRDGTLYALFTGQGKHRLELVSQQKVSESPQGRQVKVALIPSPLVSLAATLPETALDVQAEGAAAAQSVDKAKSTVLTATYPGSATAAITWKARPAVARPTRLYADVETVAVIDDGLVRVHVRAATQILQTPVSQLRFRLDAKAVVLSVSGKNVARWTEQPAAAAKEGKTAEKLLVVVLAEPVLGDQPVEIVYELDVPSAGGTVGVAAPSLEDARRDQGWLAVAATGVMDVQAGESSVPRVGVSQLPEAFAGAKGGVVQFGYRYTKPPAAVQLVLSRPKPQPPKRLATTNTLVSVLPGRVVCQALVHYEILHAGVDRLRIGLPEDVELLGVQGECVRAHSVVADEKHRILVIDPKDLLKGQCDVNVSYARRFKESDKTVAVPLVTQPDAEIDRGSVGIEVRASYELAPSGEGFERIDVKELPAGLWGEAGSPILFGYRYAAPQPAMTLGLTRHEDLSVLVAMSDYCEACTVITPDGKCVTKMMFVLRNNMKPFMTLKLPEGAEMWSALVDDRPVTPARNGKGAVLIPLEKSEEVDEEDQESYRSRRDKRRKESGELQQAERMQRLKEARLADEPRDLKPYDVEIVFVGKKVDLQGRGQVKILLPQSDVPTGHLAWAVFLPKNLRMTDSAGNLQEVANFTLPFRHFAVAEYLKRRAEEAKQLAQAQASLQEMARSADKLAMAAAAKAQGVLPVRIEIPITGGFYKFEKFLVVDETPETTITYRRKAE